MEGGRGRRLSDGHLIRIQNNSIGTLANELSHREYKLPGSPCTGREQVSISGEKPTLGRGVDVGQIMPRKTPRGGYLALLPVHWAVALINPQGAEAEHRPTAAM